MYYVYVIKSVDKSKIYIGYTANLKKRLVEHNSGCVRSTKQCNDWDVIYAEDYKDRLLAMKREVTVQLQKKSPPLSLRGGL